MFSDGSSFAGNSAWGNTRRSTYYHNNANKIRVRSEVFDAEAEKILRQVAQNSPEFQKSVADYSARKESSIGILAGKITEIDARLNKVVTERQNLDKRLSFLLEDDDLEMAQSFRAEYKKQFSALNDAERELEGKKSQLEILQKQLKAAQDTSKSSWVEHVSKALIYIGKKDFVSLRSTYRQIFQKIIVRPVGTAKVQLQFIFNDLSTAPYTYADTFCAAAYRVGASGVEPETPSL